jgi:hypothetical protein
MNSNGLTPLERLASILRWYLTVTSISLWHRAIISSLIIIQYSPLSRTLARPSERSGGAGGQDLASQSSARPIEHMLVRAGAEPTPRGGGGGGGGIAILLLRFLIEFSISQLY